MAINSDVLCQGGAIPDVPAIAFLEATTGRACGDRRQAFAADPQRRPSRLGVPRDAVLMVGDRLGTDIRMGTELGLDTALVLTGVTTREMLADSPAHPVHILDSVADIP